jgi:hypothetical protein
VILGGLVTATLLNLVLIPVMCLTLGPKQPPAAEEPEPEPVPEAEAETEAEAAVTIVPAPTVTAS